jgi:hypothetical protein
MKRKKLIQFAYKRVGCRPTQRVQESMATLERFSKKCRRTVDAFRIARDA